MAETDVTNVAETEYFNVTKSESRKNVIKVEFKQTICCRF